MQRLYLLLLEFLKHGDLANCCNNVAEWSPTRSGTRRCWKLQCICADWHVSVSAITVIVRMHATSQAIA